MWDNPQNKGQPSKRGQQPDPMFGHILQSFRCHVSLPWNHGWDMKAVVCFVTNHSKEVKTQLQILLSQIVTPLFQRSWEKDRFTLWSLFPMQSFPWLLAFVKEVDSLSVLLHDHLKSIGGDRKGKHGLVNLTFKVSAIAFEVPKSSRRFHTPFYDDGYYLLSLSSL